MCDTEKERRRSGGLWRNEGVQGQSEGTGLFTQPEDEELIRGEIFFGAEGETEKEVSRNLSEEFKKRRRKKNPPLLHFSPFRPSYLNS